MKNDICSDFVFDFRPQTFCGISAKGVGGSPFMDGFCKNLSIFDLQIKLKVDQTSGAQKLGSHSRNYKLKISLDLCNILERKVFVNKRDDTSLQSFCSLVTAV